ncbi:MAG: Gfo/Idh/MocA family oxidoreductase [Betaproteobacteria bacterium]|nr:Gfo/Idh/MocA family oxidoreductase [Betaproteobacteria bacterium]
MATRPRTVGIVGLGYGLAHLAGFRGAGCEVVAVCQRDEAAARAVAAKHGVPAVFARWEEMLERARPDIVAIATPPTLHLPILKAAMQGGMHVLCEKPLAMNRAEALEMIEIARASGRTAITGFNWRYSPAMQRFADMVRAGWLGRVFHVNARWLHGHWASESAAATWRMNRSVAGHGALGDQGVHLVDMVRWLFGDFSRVIAQSGIAYASRKAPGGAGPDAEDHSTVLGELATGAQVAFTVSRVAHGIREHSIEAYGSDGALSLRMGRDGARWHAGELHAARAGEGFVKLEVAPAAEFAADTDAREIIGRTTVAPMVRDMLSAIERGAAPSPSLEDGMHAQAVLDAALESVRTGTWQAPGKKT